ncbi:hypothetical protein K432DRAFT_444839 [Lepidopterella palustris CBS 459.81]|uniref:F-box domain-containing protein n=1 Tax=Lepidopterella palustris CBS 459.81 TaxID=1314670 RepID=A0A8E2E6G3_9PEZI|nr:hypothetical protein K432DRAFT_444839 [Lepidopterella palustris CBS 459.81]
MTPPISSLPTELFLNVARFLRHEDLVQLMTVSKRIHQIIEPLLWTKLELHRPDYHEDHGYSQSGSAVGPQDRPYMQQPPSNYPEDEFRFDEYYVETARRWLKNFEHYVEGSSQRLERLAAQVRWLCITVDPYKNDGPERDCWNALTKFINLEYLEVHAKWNEWNAVKPFDTTARPLTKLRTVKMRGYVPQEFLQYICQQPELITDLELAILDAPIGSILYHARRNPPNESETPEGYEGMTDAEAEALDDIEDFSQEEIAPRPLPWMRETLAARFTYLTRLWLCKPAEPFKHNLLSILETYYSERSDQKALEEWVSLLRAARDTLVYLTLENRLAVRELESSCSGSDDYMEYYCHGPSYERFVGTVLPVILEDRPWPALKQLQLYGIEVHGPATPKPKRAPDVNVKGQLKARFPGVSIECYLGRRILFDPRRGTVCNGGDVLGWRGDV